MLLDHQDGQNTYTILWETSYVPEKIVIRCDDEEFTYLGRDSIVVELTEDLARAGSHTFTWEAGKEHEFYVSASTAATERPRPPLPSRRPSPCSRSPATWRRMCRILSAGS